MITKWIVVNVRALRPFRRMFLSVPEMVALEDDMTMGEFRAVMRVAKIAETNGAR